MDRPAALAICAAIPLLAAAFYLLTRALPPLPGYFAALAVYWFLVLLPLILWRRPPVAARLRLILPSRGLAALNVLPVVGVAIFAIVTLQTHPVPLLILGLVALAALTNGTLEELFWRGTVLQDSATLTVQCIQIALFTSWHLALLCAAGVTITGGPFALLGGAALLGTIWTVTRMQTGSAGFGALCHAAFNLFAFSELAAKNYVTPI